MMTRSTPCTAVLGIVLGLMLIPVVSGELYAQHPDLDAAAAAKAAAGREALSHPATNPPGPKAVGTFITFDAPGAGTGFDQGTFPSSISPTGAITGYYFDANFVAHGFLRAPNGIITTFDIPGGTSTFPSSISPAGAITGSYAYNNDVNFVFHGFLRASNGTLTTFDAPGTVTGPPNYTFLGTFPSSISPDGAITGTFYDVNDVGHGFLRAKNGTFTTLDATGAGTAACPQGTQAVVINPEGVILGIYTDANNANHGFLRASDGSFATFDPPGRIAAGTVPFPGAPFSFGPDLSMNPEGVITGTYFETISGNPFGGNFRVFIRTPDGTFTTFDAATYPPCCLWSFPSGITPARAITGSFNDGFGVNHGFLRATDGTLTAINVPGAGSGFVQGTAPLGITPAGVIMGLYIDANLVDHGFVFLPRP
jgi:hypothetical protein